MGLKNFLKLFAKDLIKIIFLVSFITSLKFGSPSLVNANRGYDDKSYLKPLKVTPTSKQGWNREICQEGEIPDMSQFRIPIGLIGSCRYAQCWDCRLRPFNETYTTTRTCHALVRICEKYLTGSQCNEYYIPYYWEMMCGLSTWGNQDQGFCESCRFNGGNLPGPVPTRSLNNQSSIKRYYKK